MRVLVDTSVWSLAFRKGGPADHRAVEKLDALLEGRAQLVLVGVILQEILQAYRTRSVVRKVASRLAPFPLLALDRAEYEEAASLHRACAARGIAATTLDCLIAAAAIRHRCQLLTADRDFERIAEVVPLALA